MFLDHSCTHQVPLHFRPLGKARSSRADRHLCLCIPTVSDSDRTALESFRGGTFRLAHGASLLEFDVLLRHMPNCIEALNCAKNVPSALREPGLLLSCFQHVFQPLQTLSCVLHQVHQAAVEGQCAHFCAELSKKFFILPRKDLSLFPKIEGSENM